MQHSIKYFNSFENVELDTKLKEHIAHKSRTLPRLNFWHLKPCSSYYCNVSMQQSKDCLDMSLTAFVIPDFLRFEILHNFKFI